MGREIDNIDFSAADYQRFSAKLSDNLSALKQLLARPGFGQGDISFGAELELYIVNAKGEPVHKNQEVVAQLADPQLTLELNRYNLEYNFSPVLVKQGCFAATQKEALAAMSKINACTEQWDARVVPVGILPTLQQSDTGYHAMTPLHRFEALTNELTELRGGPFTIAIEGEDTLQLAMEDVTLEGANTSFQVHLRVSPQDYVDFYNALQLVTPLVVAMSANSPLLFGHRLWHETRIPLFKQSIDCRPKDGMNPIPARVNFGNNWVRESPYELFAEAVMLYRPLLPVCSEEDALAIVQAGGTPKLRELRMHLGSIWHWNRPVFDPIDGGHLRIELRALPAGPSIIDMLANAALSIGLAKSLQGSIRELLPAIPFSYCTANFYRAAQKGMAAKLFWPSTKQSQPEYFSVPTILHKLLPTLPESLASMGFVDSDVAGLLEVIAERLETRQTGAQWQLNKLLELSEHMHKRDALIAMFQQYQQNSDANIPVAKWR